MSRPRVGLLDADLLCYTAAATGQTDHDLDFDDGTPLTILDREAAENHIEGCLRDWTKQLRLDEVRLCWSDPDRHANWRLAVLSTYKANRDGSKPELYWELRRALEARFASVWLPGCEGDDVIGILHTGPFARRHRTVAMSADKDLRTVPGWLFDWRRENKAVRISPEEAARFHMGQTLTGDVVDNYKGLPRCGPKRAAALLDDLLWSYWCMWPVVVDEYERRGFTRADALVQARVSRILHRSDWDASEKRPILWTPPEN